MLPLQGMTLIVGLGKSGLSAGMGAEGVGHNFRGD
jgi:hypothetical protein